MHQYNHTEVNQSNEIIYQDELFTFTMNDLYFIRGDFNSNNRISVSLDISRYFDMSYLNFDNNYYYPHKNFIIKPQLEKNLRKHNLIYLEHFHTDCDLSNKSFLINKITADALSISFTSKYSLKLIPADLRAYIGRDSLEYFNMVDAFQRLQLNEFYLHKLKKVKNTDRKYRSSHNSMNVNKHIYNLNNKINLINAACMDGVYVSEDKLKKCDKYIKITNNYYNNKVLRKQIVKSYKHAHTYKKAKRLTNIIKSPFIINPLESIIKEFCDILYEKSVYKVIMIEIKTRLIYRINYKRKYKLVRFLYILISLKKYNDAAKLLINRTFIERSLHYKMNIINISPKKIAFYKKKFDLLYYNISKIKHTNTYNNCTPINTNINNYMIPEIKKKITVMLSDYTRLYKLQKNLPDQKQFLSIFYDNTTNKDIAVFKNILSVKPKFL